MSSSIFKVPADAQAQVFNLEKQRAADQRNQISKELEEIKIQFVDMKNQSKNAKAEISKLGDVLEKVVLEVAGINANSRKLVELVQYATNPCTNCKGPTSCLDGQVVGSIPGTGTIITAPKHIKYKDYRGGLVQVSANDTGVVDNGNPNYDYRPIVMWNKLGFRYCDDFTGFVYNCK